MALPPNHAGMIGKAAFRITDLQGKTLGEFEGRVEVFETEGNFRRALASWPADLAIPGQHQLTGILYDPAGKELARVAPRLVSVNITPGY